MLLVASLEALLFASLDVMAVIRVAAHLKSAVKELINGAQALSDLRLTPNRRKRPRGFEWRIETKQAWTLPRRPDTFLSRHAVTAAGR
jgi:hypothetical protein